MAGAAHHSDARLETGFTLTDVIFPAIAVGLIVLCSYLLIQTIFFASGSGETEVVGKIYYKDRVAERKFARQALWGGLENGSPVYNYDTLRTEELAEAVIELRDGTRIEMDQNTMIVIVFNEDATEISFERGGIRTVREDGEAGELSIKSDKGTVDLSSGDVALSQSEDEDLKVTLKEGEAKVSADGQTQELAENQQAEIGEELNLRTLIALQAPAANARTFLQGGGSVAFRWNTGGGQGAATLELATNRSFKSGVRRARSTNGQSALGLGEGIYYWRVVQGDRVSEVRRLTVVQNRPLQLFGPASGQAIAVQTGEAPVVFSWQANRFASSYRLLLGQTPNLSDASETGVQTTTLSQRLAPGQYYWKIVTASGDSRAVTESAIRGFRVEQQAQLPPPRPLAPRSGEELIRKVVASKGLSFNWLGGRGLKDYELQIARDANFGQVVHRGAAKTNYLSWQPGNSVQDGRYYWRVKAAGTDYSEPRPFRVDEAAELRVVAPAVGELVDLATATRPGVNFSWKKAGFAGNYRVTVATDEGLQQNSRRISSRRLSAQVAGLTPGRYFWRVELLDGTAREASVITASQVRSFVIGQLLAAPGVVFPKQGNVVDMSERDALDLRWTPSAGAAGYRVELFQLDGGAPRSLAAIDAQRGSVYRFDDLGKLREGLYEWRISAQAGEGASARRSKTIVTRFRVRLPRIGRPTFVAPREEYFLPDPQFLKNQPANNPSNTNEAGTTP